MTKTHNPKDYFVCFFLLEKCPLKYKYSRPLVSYLHNDGCPNTQEKAKCYENHPSPACYLLTLCLINGVPGVGEVRYGLFLGGSRRRGLEVWFLSIHSSHAGIGRLVVRKLGRINVQKFDFKKFYKVNIMNKNPCR